MRVTGGSSAGASPQSIGLYATLTASASSHNIKEWDLGETWAYDSEGAAIDQPEWLTVDEEQHMHIDAGTYVFNIAFSGTIEPATDVFTITFNPPALTFQDTFATMPFTASYTTPTAAGAPTLLIDGLPASGDYDVILYVTKIA